MLYMQEIQMSMHLPVFKQAPSCRRSQVQVFDCGGAGRRGKCLQVFATNKETRWDIMIIRTDMAGITEYHRSRSC